MDVRLIPKEYKKGQEDVVDYTYPFSDKPIENIWVIKFFKKINLWLFVLVIVLSLLLVASAGVYGFQLYLNSKIETLDSEITGLESVLEPDSLIVEKYKDLGITIKNLQALIANHVYATKLFDALEQLTVKKVQFTAMNADLDKAKLSLRGKAASYSELAEQMKAFKQDLRIKSLETKNIKTDNDSQVSFSMDLVIDANYLHYQVP